MDKEAFFSILTAPIPEEESTGSCFEAAVVGKGAQFLWTMGKLALVSIHTGSSLLERTANLCLELDLLSCSVPTTASSTRSSSSRIGVFLIAAGFLLLCQICPTKRLAGVSSLSVVAAAAPPRGQQSCAQGVLKSLGEQHWQGDISFIITACRCALQLLPSGERFQGWIGTGGAEMLVRALLVLVLHIIIHDGRTGTRSHTGKASSRFQVLAATPSSMPVVHLPHCLLLLFLLLLLLSVIAVQWLSPKSISTPWLHGGAAQPSLHAQAPSPDHAGLGGGRVVGQENVLGRSVHWRAHSTAPRRRG